MVGTDIGGFAGSPAPDLLTRWIEVGAFNPIYRDHTGYGTADQEPWVHGPEYEAIRKRYIELRYRLLPYTYTAVEESFRAGIPLMRPIFLEYPQAAEFYGDERDFFFGDDFLVEPAVTEMVDAEEIKLPPGAWYDFWTSTRFTDKDKIVLQPKLDEMPLYVRAGAIIPLQPVIQSTNETPVGPLELRVYPGENCRGSLYQDDGHTYNYEKGEFLRVAYSCTTSANGITVSSHIETNGRQPWWNSAEVKVYGVTSSPKQVRLGDQTLSGWHYDSDTHAVTFSVPDAVRDWSAQILQP
jgi:alpha-glucosidase